MIDSLTSVASHQALDARLLQCKQPKLFVVDIHQFKAINLKHGDEGGDFILTQMAQALSSFATQYEMELFRLKDDQFLLLADIPFELSKMEKIIMDLCDTFEKQTLSYQDKMLCIQTHIGISFDHFYGLEKAYKALFVAKAQHQPFATYSEFANTLMLESEEEILKTLQDAIASHKITLLSQAVVDTHKSVYYREILLRLEYDEMLQSPKLFLKLVREKHLYDLLLDAIMKQMQHFFSKYPQTKLGLNLTLEDIEDETRCNALCQTLASYPVLLEILCDTSILHVNHLAALARLREEGFEIVLENVTSLDSIETLSSKSVSYVKLHGDLIRALPHASEAQKKCDEMILACHAKGIRVIAAHINSEKVLEAAKKRSFDYFQGFYFEQPHRL